MLTQWNSPNGPGADYRTSDIVIANCLGDPNHPYARPPQSYTINTEATTVEATDVAADSDDRFQRIGRVHLSHPACMMPQPLEYGNSCGPGKLVFADDLASVWGVTLLAASPQNGIAILPTIQIRIIQAIRGVQITRATVEYESPLAPGYVVQLHGVESTDLEIWAWIDPGDAGLTARVALIFGVSVKMRPSSDDDIIYGDSVAPIP